MQRFEELPRYKAILNPDQFDNAKFWKGIANYENGKLERNVLDAEQQIKSIVLTSGPSALNSHFVYSPPLEDLIYMLSGHRIEGNSVDEQALCSLIQDCCKYDTLRSEIGRFFYLYRGDSILTPQSESAWYDRSNVRNPYPNFIGHWNFKLPQIEKRPLSSAFYLSVLAMAAGVMAIIMAFAILQAAAMSFSGVAGATIGAASLLGGFSIFRKDRQIHTAHARYIEAEIEGWRPAAAPSPMG